MRINPEIRRNIWLEFSLHRAIAMPLVLGVVFYIASQTFSGIPPYRNLASASGLVFFLLVKVWGGHKAAESVIDEVNDNTWDFQKLSALSPWSLTFGKLFGSTIYCLVWRPDRFCRYDHSFVAIIAALQCLRRRCACFC